MAKKLSVENQHNLYLGEKKLKKKKKTHELLFLLLITILTIGISVRNINKKYWLDNQTCQLYLINKQFHPFKIIKEF